MVRLSKSTDPAHSRRSWSSAPCSSPTVRALSVVPCLFVHSSSRNHSLLIVWGFYNKNGMPVTRHSSQSLAACCSSPSCRYVHPYQPRVLVNMSSSLCTAFSPTRPWTSSVCTIASTPHTECSYVSRHVLRHSRQLLQRRPVRRLLCGLSYAHTPSLSVTSCSGAAPATSTDDAPSCLPALLARSCPFCCSASGHTSSSHANARNQATHSSSYWMAVFARFLWGLLNGNIGVAKSYIGEVTLC